MSLFRATVTGTFGGNFYPPFPMPLPPTENYLAVVSAIYQYLSVQTTVKDLTYWLKDAEKPHTVDNVEKIVVTDPNDPTTRLTLTLG